MKKDHLNVSVKNRIAAGALTVDVIIYFFVGFVSLITIYPFIYIFSASVSNPIEVMGNNIWLYPEGLSFLSYQKVLTSRFLWRSFFNSVFFTVVITFLNSINSLLAGFALSKKGLFARKAIVVYLLITMFFSGGLIPFFILLVNIKLYNTVWALIIPGIVSIWNIILIRTYISTLPVSLRESAIIDGAGDFTILFKIIMPLAKPILAVVSLYTAIGVWNNWFSAMIFLPGKPEWHPLQLFLTKVLIWGNIEASLGSSANFDADMARTRLLSAAIGNQLKYTVIIVSSIPIIAVYPLLQKYFIKGALLGSLKE